MTAPWSFRLSERDDNFCAKLTSCRRLCPVTRHFSLNTGHLWAEDLQHPFLRGLYIYNWTSGGLFLRRSPATAR